MLVYEGENENHNETDMISTVQDVSESSLGIPASTVQDVQNPREAFFILFQIFPAPRVTLLLISHRPILERSTAGAISL